MSNFFVKPFIAIALCFVLASSTGCDSKTVEPVKCAFVAVAWVLSAIVFSESGDAPMPAIAGLTGSATVQICSNAIDVLLSSQTSPSSTASQPGSTLNPAPKTSKGAKQSINTEESSSFPVSNCNGTTSLNQDKVTFERSQPITLFIGDETTNRTFLMPPSDSDADPLASIARTVIANYTIPFGSLLTVDTSLTVTIPAHSQAIVTIPPSIITVMAGKASIQQGQTISWSYPTKIERSGTPTVSLPTAC